MTVTKALAKTSSYTCWAKKSGGARLKFFLRVPPPHFQIRPAPLAHFNLATPLHRTKNNTV